ncbi:hypothetical protein MYIN104542_23410 [Mycobacterium intermedium]|nr:hypothetical protein BV508_21495 [Mycobacterium intermedium]
MITKALGGVAAALGAVAAVGLAAPAIADPIPSGSTACSCPAPAPKSPANLDQLSETIVTDLKIIQDQQQQ